MRCESQQLVAPLSDLVNLCMPFKEVFYVCCQCLSSTSINAAMVEVFNMCWLCFSSTNINAAMVEVFDVCVGSVSPLQGCL